MRLHFLILFLLLLAGCGEKPDDPTAQVKSTLDAVERAAEDRDIDGVLQHLAPDYRDNRGRGPASVRSLLQLHFLRQGSIHALVRIEALEFPQPDRAEAELAVAVAGTPLPENGPLEGLRADMVDVKLTLVKGDGVWKVSKAHWEKAGLFK